MVTRSLAQHQIKSVQKKENKAHRAEKHGNPMWTERRLIGKAWNEWWHLRPKIGVAQLQKERRQLAKVKYSTNPFTCESMGEILKQQEKGCRGRHVSRERESFKKKNYKKKIQVLMWVSIPNLLNWKAIHLIIFKPLKFLSQNLLHLYEIQLCKLSLWIQILILKSLFNDRKHYPKPNHPYSHSNGPSYLWIIVYGYMLCTFRKYIRPTFNNWCTLGYL